jgi:hypothetical protein
MWREDKERQLRTAVLVIFFCGLAGLGNIVVGWLGWETSIKKTQPQLVYVGGPPTLCSKEDATIMIKQGERPVFSTR